MRGSFFLDFFFGRVDTSFRRNFLLTHLSLIDLFFLRMTCRALRVEVYLVGVLRLIKGFLWHEFFSEGKTTIKQYELLRSQALKSSNIRIESLAVLHGREDFLDYFKPKDLNLLMNEAGKCKNIGLVKTMVKMGADIRFSLSSAASRGNIAILELGVPLKSSFREEIFRIALHSNHLNVIKWMHEVQRFALPPRAVEMVSLGYAERWNVPQMSPTYNYLVKERGMPWGNAISSAITRGAYEVVVWMYEQGAPLPSDDAFLNSVVGSNDWMIFTWAISLGKIPMDRWFEECVRDWKFSLLKNLLEIGRARPQNEASFVELVIQQGNYEGHQVCVKHFPALTRWKGGKVPVPWK